jgi:hypothetical protein
VFVGAHRINEWLKVPLSKFYGYLPVSLKTFILLHISSYHFEAKKIMPLKSPLPFAGITRFWTDKPVRKCPHCGLGMINPDPEPFRLLKMPQGTVFSLRLGQ